MKNNEDNIFENHGNKNELSVEKNEVKNKGTLFIISGPSGVGKGTLCKAIMDLGDLSFSVSCTTRPPREGENDGVDYRFLSLEEFNRRLDESLFLEHASVHGNMYGTLRSDVETAIESGKDIVLEIDVQGASQVKSKMDCILVFVLPPSLEILEERLRGRGTDSDEKIKLRLKNAEYEISLSGEFDYRIVNDFLSRTVFDLKNIIIDRRKFAAEGY